MPGNVSDAGGPVLPALPEGPPRVVPAAGSPLAHGATIGPWHREQGCAATWSHRESLEADLAQLGSLCAEGMTPLFAAPVLGDIDVSAPWEVAFTVAHPNACLRVGVLAGPWEGGLTANLVRADAPVATTDSREPVAIIPAKGPFCVRDPGDFRLVFQGTPLRAGAVDAGEPARVRVLVQVWEAVPET